MATIGVRPMELSLYIKDFAARVQRHSNTGALPKALVNITYTDSFFYNTYSFFEIIESYLIENSRKTLLTIAHTIPF